MKTAFLILLSVLSLNIIAQEPVLKSVAPEEFNTFIHDTAGVILDCRTPGEYSQSRIEGAVNFDFYSPSFYQQIDNSIDKSTPIFIYCRSGNRSMQASRELVKRGYKYIYNLHGGKNFWLSKGFKMQE